MPPQRATRDMNIIQQLESELGKPADALPKINVGDDVEVDYLIREGDKERIQTFKGLVLAIQGRGLGLGLLVQGVDGHERPIGLLERGRRSAGSEGGESEGQGGQPDGLSRPGRRAV